MIGYSPKRFGQAGGCWGVQLCIEEHFYYVLIMHKLPRSVVFIYAQKVAFSRPFVPFTKVLNLPVLTLILVTF